MGARGKDGHRRRGAVGPAARLAVLAAVALVAAACRSGPPRLADAAALGALIPEPGASPTPTPSPAPAPRDPAELRARARAALAAGRPLGRLVRAGPASPYVLALEHPPRADAPAAGSTLLLLDLGRDPGVLVAEHDFGVDGQVPDGPGPARLAGVFALSDELGRPVLLADLRPPARSTSPPMACGWWVAEDRPRFVCAPGVVGRSRYAMVDGVLYELWAAPSPAEALRPAGLTGRALAFERGRWRETDSFRCLGWGLERALRAARPTPLERWQRSMVDRLRSAARQARASLDSATALRQLGRALDVDACDAELWRARGRLRLSGGEAARAAPDLAIALALRPGEPAALLDLADALRALRPPGRAWLRVRDALGRRRATRGLVQGAGARGPRALARSLYERFLEETEAAPRRLAAQRRRARRGLEELSPAGARARSPGEG